LRLAHPFCIGLVFCLLCWQFKYADWSTLGFLFLTVKWQIVCSICIIYTICDRFASCLRSSLTGVQLFDGGRVAVVLRFCRNVPVNCIVLYQVILVSPAGNKTTWTCWCPKTLSAVLCCTVSGLYFDEFTSFDQVLF